MGNPNITIPGKHRQKNCLASIWIDFENNISWCSPKSWLNFDEGNSSKFAEQTYLFWFHATKSILYGGLDRLKWVRGFWILRFLLHRRHWPLKSWANFHWDKLFAPVELTVSLAQQIMVAKKLQKSFWLLISGIIFRWKEKMANHLPRYKTIANISWMHCTALLVKIEQAQD